MKYKRSKHIEVIAQLDVLPSKLEAFLEYIVPNLVVSRSANGNARFDVLIDEERPQSVVFIEEWESPEAQQAYLAWRVERGDLTQLLSYLSGPPNFTTYRRVSS